MQISIKDVYVPKALRGTIVTSQSFTFQLNNCINVYTHEKLQSIYGNTKKAVLKLVEELKQTRMQNNEKLSKLSKLLNFKLDIHATFNEFIFALSWSYSTDVYCGK
mgnify:CR=1 FL=1